MPRFMASRLKDLASRNCNFAFLLAALTLLLPGPPVWAQQRISLMSPKEAWSFNNGAEFPGATGALTLDAQAQRDGRDSLKLVGDFTKGGGYVQLGRKIDNVDIRELSLWVRHPDADRITLRINDASGQTHQINLKTEMRGDWQKVALPLEQFFAKRGQADAVPVVVKYESWGGAKDGLWHGPATAIYILLGNSGGNKVRTLWINEVDVLPRPREVPGAEIKSVVRLDDIVEGEHDWRFSKGEEFKGAKGSLTVVKDQPSAGESCLKLSGDFTGGGAYVAAIKDLQGLDAKDVASVRLRVKSDNAAFLGIQLVDGTGQAHQQSRLKISADGQWHDLVLKPAQIAGGEHWGGANDGKWHGPPRQIVFTLSSQANEKAKQPILYLADIRADVLLPVFVQSAAFKNDFEGTGPLAKSWTIEGNVTIDTKIGFQGGRSLLLARSLDQIEKPCSATGPAFPAAPGQWEIGLALKSDLHSPDNSYNSVVTLECLDGAGKIIERIPVVETFGKRDWQTMTKRALLPKGVTATRFHVQLNKTYGRFWLDDLSAAYLAPAPRRDDRISRMLFATAQLGNLLFPNDPRKVSVTVEAVKPLRDDQHTLAFVVRDYWGAEQMKPETVLLKRAEKRDGRFIYQASLDLSKVPLEIGRYYELHASITPKDGEPFRNFTSLAILPEAETKKHRPEDVPFTSRNWDNRLTEYFLLSDRLGIRTCGVWGSWSAKPPYAPEAPNIELCRKLGMGVLTNTPIATIELGKKEYDEEALGQGARNFIEKYGTYRPLTVNLGNEPHGTGERVRANVAAYQIVYEAIKKADPSIVVVATSVEPNEEYFKLGYGKWCDAYDFHVYEGAEDVRKAMQQYRVLMKKYGNVKPLWSTELGLNSQGLPRHTVAVELIKVFSTFFAEGGANASWFGLLYPDGDAKLYGSSGDAHNVFDCRYNRYCPRLDAIAYYNAVNAIAIKKFGAEKQYPGGISAFLFRDKAERNLQVLWKKKGRQDVFVPLPGVKEVQVIRIDGSRRTLNCGGKGVTLSVSEDPLLLLYDHGDAALPADLGTAAASLQAPPRIARGVTELTVTLPSGSANDVDLIAPPFWTVKKAAEEKDAASVRFTLTPPEASSIREVDLIVTLNDAKGSRIGELYHRAAISE